MESYTLNPLNSTREEIEEYPPLWVKYNAGWLAYIGGISLSRKQCDNLTLGMFTVVSLNLMQNVGGTNFLEQCDAKFIFNSSGLIDSTIALPDDYYNDIIIPPPPTPGGGLDPGPPAVQEPPYSPRMDTDIPKIAPKAEGDIAKFDDLVENKIPALVQGYQVGVIFSSPEPPTAVVTKQDIWDVIYTDLGWGALFTRVGQAAAIPARPV